MPCRSTPAPGNRDAPRLVHRRSPQRVLDQRAGARALQGRPARPRLLLVQRARLSLPPAVLLALIVVGCNSQTTEHVLDGRAPTDTGKTPSVQAAFERESYAPGNQAILRIFNRARSVRLQILQSGPELVWTTDEMTMNGIGVTRPVTVAGVRRGRRVSGRIGPRPSGLYFARLTAPRRAHRVALRRPAQPARRTPDGRSRADAHVAGVQPARRQSRRHRRQLVRLPGRAREGLPRPAMPYISADRS